jgi:hypothetical protein
MPLANALLDNEALRKFFSGRRRFQLAWVFAALLVFQAQTYPNLAGIAVCALGALIRVYASGFLRKEAKLTVGGPYAYTRNPLYLGTLVMALGATISVGAFWLAAWMGVVLSLNYYYVIEHEERKLPSIFGPAYEAYCRLVPRFFPQFKRPPQAELEKINSDLQIYEFSRELAHQNKALEAVWSFLGLIAGCALLVWIKINLGWLEL